MNPDRPESDPSPTDPERFMRLYAANQRRVYGFIRTLVANPTDAEDLVQQTVAVLWRKRDTFTAGTDFGAWAIQIARYEVLNHIRRTQPAGALDADVLEQLADESLALMDEADARREALHGCLAKLPSDHRELLRLHYEDGLSVRHIAADTGKAYRTVYRTLDAIHGSLLRCIRMTLRGGS